eukprot:403333003
MSSKERTQPTHNRRSQQQSISSNSGLHANKKHQQSVLQQQSKQSNQQNLSKISKQSQQSAQSASDKQKTAQQINANLNDGGIQGLPEKLDTQKVIEMIRNADLYDLINISLRSSELKNEQVEQFIQRALEKGHQGGHQQLNQSSHQNNNLRYNQNINPQQMDLIFTPPSKISLRQAAGCASTSPGGKFVNHNDENQTLIYPDQNTKKQQLTNLFARQHHNRSQQNQEPLQPSILQNQSNIQYDQNYQQTQNLKPQYSQHLNQQQYAEFQSFSDKNQLMQQFFEQLAQRQAQLENDNDSCYESKGDQQHSYVEDEEFHNQIPREQIPQPYSDQPTSPTDENLPEKGFQQQNQSIQQHSVHYRNDSFSDQDFALQQVNDSQSDYLNHSQRVHEPLHQIQEAGYKGDQFSFQLKKRESLLKRSPGSSNYSTLKDSQRSASKNQRDVSESKQQQRTYGNQLKMKYQQQQANNETQPQLNRNLSNFRAFQHQQTLNRSTSTNCIQKSRNDYTIQQQKSFQNIQEQSHQLTKVGSTKNLNQSQNLQKSFLQQSASRLLDESLNKTPRGIKTVGLNLNCSLINNGSMTQRFNNPSLQTPQNQSDQDRSSIMNLRKGMDTKKLQLSQQIQSLNIMHIRELERIKKPSQLAYLTSRLVCQFFHIFNVAQQNKPLHMEDLIEWDQVQMHINQFVMKYFNDLISQIKVKLLCPETMNQALKDSLEIRLLQLKEQYFTGENLKIFKHLSTNKNMQIIVNFILTVINYFSEIKSCDLQRDSSLLIETQDSYALPGHNYEALITQRAQDKAKVDLELSQTRTKTRNHNLNNKLETTPTVINSQKAQQQNEKPSLQKSASRCLLQRRDRSQLILNQDSHTYQSNNKAGLNKSQVRDVSFNKNQATNATVSLVNTKELSVSRKQKVSQLDQTLNSAKRMNLLSSSSRQKSTSRSPLNVHRKINITSTLNQSSLTPVSSNPIAQKVQQFTQRNTDLLQQIDFSQDLNEEAPMQLNYKLMIESSEITAKIRESTAAIEENMRFLHSPAGAKNHIDMSLIEQIKQRRKDQLEREKSEDRISNLYGKSQQQQQQDKIEEEEE